MKKQVTKKSAPLADQTNAMVIVQNLQKKANPIGRKVSDLQIKSQEDFDLAAQLVKQLKDYKDTAVVEKKHLLEPVKETMSRITNFFKPFENWVDEIEQDTKLKMSVYLQSIKAKKEKLDRQFETGQIKKASTYIGKASELRSAAESESATVRELTIIEVVDIRKIPLEFLQPDMTKIKAAWKAGNPVPGTKQSTKSSIAI
jgi:hypothetical protein